MKRKRLTVAGVVLTFFLVVGLPLIGDGETSPNRAIRVSAKGRAVIKGYQASYALVIGVSRYTAGWPKLTSIPQEMEEIEAALKSQGFKVTKVMDPNAKKLKASFEEFIGNYGYSAGNRLLFFFSGHGHSREDGMGYLVPTDAPDPRKDQGGFYSRALSMSRIITWCREMTASHALFLFDSCFSGTVFKAKALPAIPPHISVLTVKPVRQFISAGDAGEEVPAKSVFAPSFIKGLRGEADLSGDGFITGTELGMYLHDKVIYYASGQTPQYGKIKDPQLDEGDFVFELAQSDVIANEPSSHPPVRDIQASAGDHNIRAVKEDYKISNAQPTPLATILAQRNTLAPIKNDEKGRPVADANRQNFDEDSRGPNLLEAKDFPNGALGRLATNVSLIDGATWKLYSAPGDRIVQINFKLQAEATSEVNNGVTARLLDDSDQIICTISASSKISGHNGRMFWDSCKVNNYISSANKSVVFRAEVEADGATLQRVALQSVDAKSK